LLQGWRIQACYASAFVCLLLVVSPSVIARNAAFPQSSSNPNKHDYALIYGTVWGPDDRPVAGVAIKIRPASAKKAKWDLVSNSVGEFAQRVPAGREDYIVEAEIKMPKGQPKPQVKVHIDNDERQDIGIHLTKEELPHH
jgi:hypothetical protein